MEVRRFISLMNQIEKLKCFTRHSWTSNNRQESVAEHSWRLALMSYFVKDEFPEADVNKVILMCLCHDFGEIFTGDIPAFLKTEDDEVLEQTAVDDMIKNLSFPYRVEMSGLFKEMSEMKTLEARIYKALDKMEAIIQHNEADISTWLPLEYHENMVYGQNEVLFSEYMKNLRHEIYKDSVGKIAMEDKKYGNRVIYTERLKLRPLNILDLNSTHSYSSDFETTKYMKYLPHITVEETRKFLEDVDNEWKKERPTYFEFAILLVQKHIGAISVYLNDTGTEGELGWIIHKDYWGNGYVTEVAKAIKEYAIKELKIKKLTAYCDSRNIGSYRVMEKIGMTLEREDGFRKDKVTNQPVKELMYSINVRMEEYKQ